MLANNLISSKVKVVNSCDKGKKVLNIMDVLRVSHLPVTDNKCYMGLVSDKLIYDFNLIDKCVGDEADRFITEHVHEQQHIYEVAMLMYKSELTVMPVLNSEHCYFGAITLYDMSRRLANYFSVQEIGGVVVIEAEERDYSITKICQIIEENGIKILSFLVNRLSETNRLELVFKVNNVELSPVIQSLGRYGYNVKSVYLDNSVLKDLYQDRYEHFMKFMNI